jgi:hypothetical protein
MSLELHEHGGLICGEVASAWVVLPPIGVFRHPLIRPAVPARSRGAGGAAGAARRAATGIMDIYPPDCGFLSTIRTVAMAIQLGRLCHLEGWQSRLTDFLSAFWHCFSDISGYHSAVRRVRAIGASPG